MQKGFVQKVQTQFWFFVAQPIGVLSAGIMLTGTTIALTAPVQAASLDWQYDPDSAALSLNLPRGSTPRYFLAAQPARIVVDLPNTDVGTVLTEKQFPGAVQQIRIAQFQPGTARIVMQLAPGTVLAPQQVDLQQNGDRWVLRPVLATADSAPPVAATPANLPSHLPASTAVAPAAVAPAPSADSILANPTLDSAVPADLAATTPAVPTLPPLEPGATEIPVELPPAEAAAAAPPTVSVPALSAAPPSSTATPPGQNSSSTEATTEPEIAALSATAENPVPQALAAQAPEVIANQLPAEASLAPAAEAAPLPDNLPNLSPAESEPTPLPTELPPATVMPASETTVNVPALDAPPPSSVRTQDIAAIEFGQPLPGENSANEPVRASSREAAPEASAASRRETAIAVNSAPGILLPSGTVLTLRYAGEETLSLANDYPLQEVLVVDRDVTNPRGQVIVPAGSQVIGRFETGSSGSEFIAQAISINGQNFLLNGRSDKLSGGRQVPRNHLLQNSALGAVAGTLLGAVTGVGLIAGIAAGAATSAATTYLTAPQPAVIEPDRVIEVRLLEDLSQPGYGIGG